MAIAREPVQIPDITQGGAYQSHVRDLLESNEWKLGRFVFHLDYDVTPGKHCPALWRSAGIGSTHKGSAARDETHFLYPCIGPLSDLDLSFPGAEDFQRLW